MNAAGPVREEDLHAYVDGELDESARADVESWLAEHADDAKRVSDWQRQNVALRAAFDDVLDEPLTGEIQAALAVPLPRRPMPVWMRAAAAIVLLAAGVAGGWGLRGSLHTADDPSDLFVGQAISAHVVYAAERRHAVEVKADEKPHLTAWLSKRLGQRFEAPQLVDEGFHFVGGRLVADAGRPAAQLMYEDGTGRRITVYARRAQNGGASALAFVSRNGLVACYWVEGGLALGIVGPLEPAKLRGLAQIIYTALEP